MRLPRNLRGRDFANHLIRHWSFRQVRQVGSDIQLQSDTPKFTMSIPEHSPVKVGTLQGILRQIANQRGVSAEEVLRGL